MLRRLALVCLLLLAGCGSAGAARPGADEPVTPTTLRAPSPGDPLRVLVVGDSLARELFLPVEAGLEDTEAVRVDFESIPSIPRQPDLDQVWDDALATYRPELVIVLVGYWEIGVLDQRLPPLDRYRVQFLDPFVDDVRAIGGQVLWIGPPVVSDPALATLLAGLGDRLQSYADGAEAVDYLDGNALVAGPDGGFADVVDGPGGPERVRYPDGLHLCPDGSARIAASIFAWIDDEWGVAVTDAWRTGPWRNGLFSGAEVCPEP